MSFEKVAAYLDQLVAKGVPGCDVIVQKDHQQLYRYSAGYRDYARTQPVSPTDMYYVYSCTKPITVAAAMQLVEQGKLGLDAPLADYLPAFAHMQVRCGEGTKPAQKPILIRHLFTMSAGLDYNMNAEPIKRVLQATGGQATTRELMDALAEKPLDFEPGDRFQYSLCHDVLAAVIEAVSGMTYEAYLKKNLFAPLGIQDASMHRTAEIAPRIAAHYAFDAENQVLKPMEKPDFNLSPKYESGGGGLIASLDAYALFADAMACGGVGASGARILGAETIDLIRTEQLSTLVRDTSFGCSTGAGYGYGLGVRTLVDRSQGQRSPLGEFGWDGAAGAYGMMDPENHLSVVYAHHILNWPAMLGNVHAPLRDLVYEALGL